MHGRVDVLVVGCGVVGLTSAIRLAESGRRVRIVARERSPRTTSDIAAAVWYPFLVGPRDRALAWSRRTYQVLRDLVDVAGAGVTWVEGIELLEQAAVPEPWWKDALDHWYRAGDDDLPPGFAGGFRFEAPVVRMPVHLPWLERRFQDLGGSIETREVRALDDLFEEAGAVVHCAGLGARDLAGDDQVVPIRGQVVRVGPGHAARFVQAAGRPGALAYVIPRPDCTVLGGTDEVGAWHTTPDPAVAAAILERCIALVPGLAKAPILSHAVGLRPGRPAVRLEAETRTAGLVVHNYGHGGAGVTLSWGCAEEVVALVGG